MAQGHNEEFDPVHHISDGNYVDLEPIAKVELPRIFLTKHPDGAVGLDVFASTTAALNSGTYVIAGPQGAPASDSPLGEAPSEGFEVTHEQAEEGNPIQGVERIVKGASHLDSELAPADGGAILVDFSITRHLVFAIIAGLIVMAIFIPLARRYKRGIGRETAPRGIYHNLFETLVVWVRDEIAKPNLGPKYQRFLPYLLTIFFFILTCNLMGVIPYGAVATSNLMVTAVLATFTFVITQVAGTKDYWRHVFAPPGVPKAVWPILIPVEILGLFTKPIALAIRLFANMTAGHLVILSMIGLIFTFKNLFGLGGGWGISPISVAFTLFINLLELLVAFIQAYVFTLLSALFIGMAVQEHADHAHDHYGEFEGAVAGDHAHVTPHIMPGSTAGDHVVPGPAQTIPTT
ncbi:MAG TPA: F0F1 ATP synthase subunit A [Rhodothermales bacterium]|nr:F0F1 ATP synthase subunit A [Rhodothermales bacterium]